MGPFRYHVEKQAYEFTILTFNKSLGYLQDHPNPQREDWEYVFSLWVKAYQVWKSLWARQNSMGLKPVEQLAKWVEGSGVLRWVRPIMEAEDSSRESSIQELLSSKSFLLWVLSQVRK